ncbi:MAG TPA: putative sulfate exporter family transporter [Phycisphaerae bacterium]|nr:putative sulfate exporter family transporter [Phycisphaerae bacterium]
MTAVASPYIHLEDPFHISSLDSMEGIPDFAAGPKSTPAQSRPHAALAWVGLMLPGISLALALAWAGYALSELLGRLLKYDAGKSPVSPVTVAVLLGILLRNTVGVPKAYEAGLRFCIKSVLRLGIVILGLTLSVKAIGSEVVAGLPVIVCCIATALLLVTFINRALGLPRRLGTLIAVGTSICGVTAIVATAPIIDADEDETAYAVACITIFGLLAMITYPFLAHEIFATPTQAGTFLGTAIHDTSQVAGASLSYAQQYKADAAMKTAITVKLVRNLCMSLLIPLMAILYRRSESKTSTRAARQKWHQVVPLFVIAFVLMACIRSLGDAGGSTAFGLFTQDQWKMVDPNAKFFASWLLATALGAVGLGTGIARLKGIGLKPFSVGFAAALSVGVVSFALIKLLASFTH